MDTDPALPDRSRPAAHPWKRIGNRNVIVFVTVCTKDRKPILANAQVHRLLLESWCEANAWTVGRYVIMPDHLHLFAAPATDDAPDQRRWVAFWKSLSARRWPDATAAPVWQTEAWDRQLRSGDSYAAKWEYVRMNPVRHGFVEKMEDWPYQGEIESLPWHD